MRGTESLRTLKMPWTDLSNDQTIFESVATKLSNLTYLDISHCSGIGVEAIRAIGHHCKNLERFDMNSLRFYYNGESWAVRVGIPSEVALAIASTMPKLKHLEIFSMQLGNEDLLKILNSCAQLQYLDISECIVA
ncbi:hypothetical protein G4B88_026924 [Cannabis sativa]|uniref:Uncharacterized protein n=2 Tax=Cannabis sativa TaxID=3483 RepID=A0A7J6EGH8_CANSA|nr:hypothetical protein G4B88_026924 [Cannabis sativa]